MYMLPGYSSLTPYQYGANDPVYFNDPTGALLGGLYGEDESVRRRAEAGFGYVDGNNGGLNRFYGGGNRRTWYNRNPGGGYSRKVFKETLKVILSVEVELSRDFYKNTLNQYQTDINYGTLEEKLN